MPAALINFPISAIVDGLLSYIQYIFGNPDITPSEYRWNVDDRQSFIRIGGPFVIDNEKPMSAPFIVVERGPFTFDNRIIDNLKAGGANTFTNPLYAAICDGTINIICGSAVAAEASSLANYLAIMLQSDRHTIIGTLQFLRNLYHVDISPEIPVVKDTQVRRWEVTLRIFVSLQMGWIKTQLDTVQWNSATIYNLDGQPSDAPLSIVGSINTGSDLLVDNTQNFGILSTNSPQFLQSDLTAGRYYIRFKDYGCNAQVYPVAEIVNNHTLRLLDHDVNNNPIPWSAPETSTAVKYNLLYDSLHLKIEIPNNHS